MKRKIILRSDDRNNTKVKVTIEVDSRARYERWDLRNKVNSLASAIMKGMGDSSICPYLTEIERK